MTRRRFRLALVSLALSALALSGCAGAPVPLQPATAEQLQSAVLEVTTAAAEGDLTGAQALLTSLEASLRTAAAGGQVTPERSAEIQAAINLVGTDLATAIDAAQAEADARAAAEAQAAQEAADKEAADKAAKEDADKAAKASDEAAKAAEEAKKAADEAAKKDEKGNSCKKDDEDC